MVDMAASRFLSAWPIVRSLHFSVWPTGCAVKASLLLYVGTSAPCCQTRALSIITVWNLVLVCMARLDRSSSVGDVLTHSPSLPVTVHVPACEPVAGMSVQLIHSPPWSSNRGSVFVSVQWKVRGCLSIHSSKWCIRDEFAAYFRTLS